LKRSALVPERRVITVVLWQDGIEPTAGVGVLPVEETLAFTAGTSLWDRCASARGGVLARITGPSVVSTNVST
jgi:hypothetical protein